VGEGSPSPIGSQGEPIAVGEGSPSPIGALGEPIAVGLGLPDGGLGDVDAAFAAVTIVSSVRSMRVAPDTVAHAEWGVSSLVDLPAPPATKSEISGLDCFRCAVVNLDA
jgi:hypothetical protein